VLQKAMRPWCGTPRIGMLVAVLASFFNVFGVSAAARPHLILNIVLAVVALVLGGGAAWWKGRKVAMTAMPQMVGGVHGVLITAPSLIAFKQSIGMTRKLGTCVLVGLPPGEFPVPLFDVVANCITIRGSFVGTREDMAQALDFAARGKVKADIELQPLSAINDVFTRLEAGYVAARVVLDFQVGSWNDDSI
jgi:D-arabinose 1-dehydrogenase-like Zn-dependent alcohol dehydrogenase